jgi:hypothetical protein
LNPARAHGSRPLGAAASCNSRAEDQGVRLLRRQGGQQVLARNTACDQQPVVGILVLEQAVTKSGRPRCRAARFCRHANIGEAAPQRITCAPGVLRIPS